MMKLFIPVSVLQLSHSPLFSLSLAHTLMTWELMSSWFVLLDHESVYSSLCTSAISLSSLLSLAHTHIGDVGLNVFRCWADILGTILGTHSLIVVFMLVSVLQAYRFLTFKQYWQNIQAAALGHKMWQFINCFSQSYMLLIFLFN